MASFLPQPAINNMVNAVTAGSTWRGEGITLTQDEPKGIASGGARWPGSTRSRPIRAVVPCAVWDDDELMVLRLRGDLGSASEFTLSRRVAGTEVSRATVSVAASSHDEIIDAEPAARIRQLPAVEVEHAIGNYTLVHQGLLHR